MVPMDTAFRQWVALTDAYAHRLSDAMRGDTTAFQELKHLADDVQKHHPSFETDEAQPPPGFFATFRTPAGGAERH